MRFFDKNNLTKEQKQNWNFAISQYKKIRKYNILHSFETLTENDKKNILIDLNKVREYNDFNIEIDEKSALFGRLLNNNKALKYPPPCAYSYPWYSVIEDEGPWELRMQPKSIKEILWENLIGKKQVIIEQTPWDVIEYINDTHMIVSYGEWHKENHLWMLMKKDKLISKTNGFILCTYDTKKYKVTNEEELIEEIKYKNKEIINKLSTNNIQRIINEELLNYYRNGYSKDEEGNLYYKIWELTKVSPNINDVYMK